MAVTTEVARDTGSYLRAVGLEGRLLMEAVRLMRKLPDEVNHRLGQGLPLMTTLFRDPKTGLETWIVMGDRPSNP